MRGAKIVATNSTENKSDNTENYEYGPNIYTIYTTNRS